MTKIQFDTVNGVCEVAEFDDDAYFCGCFSDHCASPEFFMWLKEDFEGVRSMEVGDAVYAMIDKEYGIKAM